MKYPLAFNSWDKKEKTAAIRVINSGSYTMGAKVKIFEKNFAKKFKSKFAVMVNSGSSANLLMLSVLKNYPNILKKKNISKPNIIVPTIGWSTSYYPIKPSVTGSDVTIGTPIDDITFQIDPTVGIGSGSGGFSVNENSRTNPIQCGYYETSQCAGLWWYGSDYRSDYGTGTSFDWSALTVGEVIVEELNYGYSGTGAEYNTAVDSNGHIHIVFVMKSSGLSGDSIRYVTNQSGSWQSVLIEENVGSMSSIALDSNDNVHIAYFGKRDSSGNTYSNGEYALKYATNQKMNKLT